MGGAAQHRPAAPSRFWRGARAHKRQATRAGRTAESFWLSWRLARPVRKFFPLRATNCAVSLIVSSSSCVMPSGTCTVKISWGRRRRAGVGGRCQGRGAAGRARRAGGEGGGGRLPALSGASRTTGLSIFSVWTATLVPGASLMTGGAGCGTGGGLRRGVSSAERSARRAGERGTGRETYLGGRAVGLRRRAAVHLRPDGFDLRRYARRVRAAPCVASRCGAAFSLRSAHGPSACNTHGRGRRAGGN